MATGCSAVTARAAVGCVMRDMADPLAACNVRIRDFYPQPRVVLSPQSTIFGSRGIMQIPERVLYIPEGEGSASLARLRRRRVGQVPDIGYFPPPTPHAGTTRRKVLVSPQLRDLKRCLRRLPRQTRRRRRLHAFAPTC